MGVKGAKPIHCVRDAVPLLGTQPDTRDVRRREGV